jgi:hypothetical protein
MEYIVVCRNDRRSDGSKGDYALATRRVFTDRTAAETYAEGISTSREPVVVEGAWLELRFGGES